MTKIKDMYGKKHELEVLNIEGLMNGKMSPEGKLKFLVNEAYRLAGITNGNRNLKKETYEAYEKELFKNIVKLEKEFNLDGDKLIDRPKRTYMGA